MRSVALSSWVLLGLFLFGIASQAQQVQQQIPTKTRILFLLDGSGSMLGRWGSTLKMDAAKELLADMVDSLRTNQNLELALRVYGHRYQRESQNCQDTKLEVSFGRNNHNAVIERLRAIKPKGTTPIAYSLEKATEDFPQGGDYRNIIILITDGIESCEGDPCNVSMRLQRNRIFLRPFVIGLGMTKEYQNDFGCLGQYFDARDKSGFQRALNKAVNTSLGKTTASVELLDSQGRPRETNVNVTFLNNFTGLSEFEFVHYRDRNGKPDSVVLDPVLSYDVVANTVPPVVKKNLDLIPGKHNIISLKTPQGNLQVKQKGYRAYEKGVKVIVRKSGNNRILHVQDIEQTQKYLTGTYNVEVHTLPKRIFSKVEISQSEITTLSLPDPGILNIRNNASGFGSIYEIDPSGRQQWVCDLERGKTRMTYTIQPGEYKIVFRAESAPGSKYTSIKDITVKSGISTIINLFD